MSSEKEEPRKPRPKGPSPRVLRYGWAASISGLLALGLLTDTQSAWLPLINQAIDLLQLQHQPNR